VPSRVPKPMLGGQNGSRIEIYTGRLTRRELHGKIPPLPHTNLLASDALLEPPARLRNLGPIGYPNSSRFTLLLVLSGDTLVYDMSL